MSLRVRLSETADEGVVLVGAPAKIASPGARLSAPGGSQDWTKLVTTNNDPTIRFQYDPEPKDQGSKIVFIQVMQEFLDDVASLPSQGNAPLAYRDPDTTTRKFHVDYVAGEKDPYYNGDDPKLDAGVQGNAVSTPKVSATMNDTPDKKDANYPSGKTKVRWEFRTAVFSADSADKGTYYQYQDWTYTKEKGKTSKITLKLGGADPGQDFKDAVTLWCKNHGFSLPSAAPPPPPPPPPKPGQKSAVYVVVPGDYLSKIALKFYGNGNLWPKIYDANKDVIGGNPNLIYPGQTLVIP